MYIYIYIYIHIMYFVLFARRAQYSCSFGVPLLLLIIILITIVIIIMIIVLVITIVLVIVRQVIVLVVIAVLVLQRVEEGVAEPRLGCGQVGSTQMGTLQKSGLLTDWGKRYAWHCWDYKSRLTGVPKKPLCQTREHEIRSGPVGADPLLSLSERQAVEIWRPCQGQHVLIKMIILAINK